MRPRWLRILRWTGISAAVLVAVLGLALYAGYAFVQSDAGRARLVEALNNYLSTPGESQVRIGRLEGDLLGRIEIHGLSVGDGDGIWLRLQFIGVSWRPSALLNYKLSISKLDANGLNILRLPTPSQSSAKFEWPELPIRIAIEDFSLEQAELAQPVLGEAMTFQAFGDSVIEGASEMRTTIAVQRTDATPGEAKLDFAYKPRSNALRFDLAFSEAESGMLARTLDLQGLPSLSIQAEGEGPLDALQGSARMLAGNSASVESRFKIDASAARTFDLAGSADLAALVDPALRELLAGKLDFEVQGALADDGFSVSRGWLRNPLASVQFSGALRDYATDFEISVAVDDLAPFESIAGVPLQGQASVSSSIHSADFRRAAHASTRASFSDLLPAASPLAALLGPRIGVSGALEFEADRHWALRDFTLTGASVELNANATLGADSNALGGDYRLILGRLAGLSDALGTPLAGSLAVAGDITGSLEQPAASARLTSPGVSVDGVAVGAVEARVNIARSDDTISGDIDASIDNTRLGTMSAASRFSTVAGETVKLDGLVLQSREFRLAGSMTIKLSDATVDGKLAGQIPRLSTWSDLVGRALSGQADLALDMSSSGGAQRVGLSVKARDLQLALDDEQSLRVDAFDVSARLEDAFRKPRGGMRLLASDVRAASARMQSAMLEVEMESPRRLSASFKSRGELHEPFTVEALADYDARDSGFAVTVSKLDATFAGQAITLSKPARLEQAGATTELSRLTLAVADGQLSVAGKLGLESLSARLELENINLAVVKEVTPLADVTGTLSGHASVSGTRSAPVGELDFKAADLGSAHTALAVAPPVSARLRGNWRDTRLQLLAAIEEIAETRLDARASVGLRLDPETLAVSLPADDAMDGTLRWAGELGSLWDLLSIYEDRYTGPGELAIEISGTTAEPKVSGFVQLADGRYENVQTGTTLTDIKLRVVAKGDKLVIEELSAGDGKSGILEGSGTIDVIPAQFYPTNLRLDFSNMLLVARDELILNADGHLKLEGTLSNALLSGEIITGDSELLLSGTLPVEVVELDVREVDSTSDLQAQKKKPTGAAQTSVIIIDLDISVPGRAFVRGLGLDSEWKGDVKVSGSAKSPNVAGVLNPVRGQFSLMGKSFRLEQGAIRFTGSDNIDPLLDLTAQHTTTGLTAMVRVTGSASKPKIALTSRPPLPESEIASRVLFGTESSNLTPGQSLQLASAIATFSGTGGAVGVLDATRRALGVDVINFAESEQNPDSTRVSIGKYVADGVYIEVEQGSDEGSRTATTVEVEVLPDVRVEGGTTETGGNKVGVKWKWDY
jgi:translocation and assembly module TamB